MIERIYRISAILGIFLGFIVLLSGCATIQREGDLKESLRSAASNYWKMRLEGKLEDTFKMEEKEELISRNKQGLPLNDYYRVEATITGPIISYSIKKVQVLDGKGRVDLEFSLTLPEMSYPARQLLTDSWIFKDGKWRHIFSP